MQAAAAEPSTLAGMTLAAYTAEVRQRIFDALLTGNPPPEGAFSEEAFREGKAKGTPQMGTTRFEPDAIVCEFIYTNSVGAPILLSVRLQAPERVVFMPVPAWVVQSIWQGEVAGSPRFESEAREMLAAFERQLAPETNPAHFAEPAPVGRQ